VKKVTESDENKEKIVLSDNLWQSEYDVDMCAIILYISANTIGTVRIYIYIYVRACMCGMCVCIFLYTCVCVCVCLCVCLIIII